jgi:hypothetical protein
MALLHVVEIKKPERMSTVRFFRTDQKEGARSVSKALEHYNLDA